MCHFRRWVVIVIQDEAHHVVFFSTDHKCQPQQEFHSIVEYHRPNSAHK